MDTTTLSRRTFLKGGLMAWFGGMALAACRQATPTATPPADGVVLGSRDTSIRTLGTQRELFVDDWLIDRFERAELRLHPPQPKEVALALDAPWEGPWSHYVTIMDAEGDYRMYYRGLRPDARGQEGEAVTAVAVSRDGILWERPSLRLHEWEGARDNNIVWRGATSHNFAPFRDANPAAPEGERFKAVGSQTSGSKQALFAFGSADGYRWDWLRQEPILRDGAFDSQNLAYWDTHRGHYVAFYRDFRDDVRSIKTATSDDFRTWTPGTWADFGDAPPEHLYTNATVSYFRAPHIYLAFPKRFLPDRKVVPSHPEKGVSDGVFMSSRDGVHWDRRFMEAFLRPGHDLDNWTERSNAIAWGILPTAPHEISLYWLEHYRHPTIHVRRGVVRTDGFVSVHGGYFGGSITTHPLTFAGTQLALNYATSAAGSVQVEMLDAAGTASLRKSHELIGDEIDGIVRWPGATGITDLVGQTVRLRVTLKDADLYALQFQQP